MESQELTGKHQKPCAASAMARVFLLAQLIYLMLPHFAASNPEVSATIVRKIGSETVVKEGQAAYVEWDTRISEVLIKCTWPGYELYTGYEIHRRNNGTQRTLVHSGKPARDDTGRYRMTKETFLPGAYWCVGQEGEANTSSDDAVYLGEQPKVSLKQLQPFPANGGTARFVCEVEDALTPFRIDRKLDYQYINESGDTHNLDSSTPGGEWIVNGTELVIANAVQDWAKSVQVSCRVVGLSVRDSAAEDFDFQGYYYSSRPPVPISFTDVIPTPAPVVFQPTHAAAIVVVGIVLLALVSLILVLSALVFVRWRRRRTQPADDTEQGVPGDPHHRELVQAPGEGYRRSTSRDLSPTPRLPLPVPGHVVTPLPGACVCDCHRERHWTEGVQGCG